MTPFPNLTGCAGAAFLLSSSPGEDITFNHPEGCVSLRRSAPHVTVSLAATKPPEMIRATAWRVVQESLDVLAATGRAALTTSEGDTNYLLWEFVDDVYDLICVSTAEIQWSMEASAKVGPSTVRPPPFRYTHHETLRFYRMSKCTSDLFDAYRNAYLGLECLVSSESPKSHTETELSWLKRVVTGPLGAGVPGGIDPNALLDAIYKNGRNPLFHAKVSNTFYPPHGEMREEIQELFEKLSLLLVALVQYKLGNHVIRRWGSTSQILQDNQTLAAYDFDELQFKTDSGAVSLQPQIEVVTSTRRFGQFWLKAKIARPAVLTSYRIVKFLRQGKDWIDLAACLASPNKKTEKNQQTSVVK